MPQLHVSSVAQDKVVEVVSGGTFCFQTSDQNKVSEQREVRHGIP